MFEWLKTHKKLVMVISGLIIFGVPLIIHILFKIEAPNSFFVAEWSAGELLSYYGSILAFIGTVVLGILALYQNHIIKIEADRRTEILEQREYDSNMPKFIAIPTGSNGLRTNLRFSIRNISENLASEVELYDIKVLKPNNEVFWTSDTNYKYLSLSSNEEIKIELKNPALQGDGYIFSLEMQCVDKFDKQHKYMIKGICEKIDTFPVFKITELI